MADTITTPILSVCATVGSKLSELAIKNGQLIFVRDKHEIALDYNDKRVFYKQIEELATEQGRTSLLAPVTGLYYFVVETATLWTYRNGWVQITTPPSDMISLDTTLAQEGKAADAKAVGDAIANLNVLPSYTDVDNGKFLRVVAGSPVWATIPNAEDGEF